MLGRDVVRTGGGDDHLRVVPDAVEDVVRCGPGVDTVVLRRSRDESDRFIGCENLELWTPTPE